jgi:hypothetical protein
MMRASRDEMARRKALLVSRAELDRLQIALAVHQLRDTIAPPRSERTGSGRVGPIAAALVSVGLPLLGRKRLGHWLRIGSLALTAFRAVRNWR